MTRFFAYRKPAWPIIGVEFKLFNIEQHESLKHGLMDVHYGGIAL
jgi:hypothetical protein